MVKFNHVSKAMLALSSLTSLAIAHPEHHEMEEALMRRDEHAAMIQRGLENCANSPSFRAIKERAQARRWEKAQKLRQARGIPLDAPYKAKMRKRDLAALETFETVNHNYTSSGYTESTSASTLFANYKNVSCILTPEVTQGPYYVTGEYVRTNVVETQEGVPVHLEYQYIDISTCEAATGLHLETWQANATGVYSGIVASGNGNDADTSNLNTTFLRGVTAVDDEGVAYFDTLFAGHYQGRATHIHLITHQGGEEHSNGTYSGGTISHVGQLFFDEDLKDAVEATAPYNTNTAAITTNDEDMWAPDQADNNYDPIPDYAYLGNDISDGLLMWISIGINMSAEYTVSIAGSLTADGGVVSSDGTLGSGGTTGGSGDSTGGGNGTGTNSMGGSMTGGGGFSGSAPTGTAGGDMGGSSGQAFTTASVSSSSAASAVVASSSTASSSVSSVSSSVKSSATSATSSVQASAVQASSSVKSSATSAVSSVKSSATPVASSVKSSAEASAVQASTKKSSSISSATSSTHKTSSTSSTLSTSTHKTSSTSSTLSTSTHKTSSATADPVKTSTSTSTSTKKSSTKKTSSATADAVSTSTSTSTHKKSSSTSTSTKKVSTSTAAGKEKTAAATLKSTNTSTGTKKTSTKKTSTEKTSAKKTSTSTHLHKKSSSTKHSTTHKKTTLKKSTKKFSTTSAKTKSTAKA